MELSAHANVSAEAANNLFKANGTEWAVSGDETTLKMNGQQRMKLQSNDTVRENMRWYAQVIAKTNFDAEELDSLIRYAMEYQSRMGW